MLDFIKFVVGGLLVLIPVTAAVLVLGEIAYESPRARAFIVVVALLSVMIVGGTELILSATNRKP